MKTRRQFPVILSLLLTALGTVGAKGPGSSAGITLLQPPGARSSAVGEAFTSATDDITAMTYNPASLRSLQNRSASYLYQRGIADDYFSQLMIGVPREKDALGFSLGYLNGGKVDLFDGTTSRSVTAKTDLILTGGYAREFERVALGVNAKYISSELGETVKASAVAVDLGADYTVNDRLKLGASALNLGTALKYVNESVNLPRVFRTGLTYLTIAGQYPTYAMFDLPYYANEQQLAPSVGLETLVGPLALRAGYRSGSDLEAFTFGTGFNFGHATLDYSLGLVNTLDTRHMISFSMEFGKGAERMSLVKEERPKVELIGEKKEVSSQPLLDRMYEVKAGDTLEKIAEMFYGDRRMWTKIFYANIRVLKKLSVANMVGKKLIIP